MPISFLVNLYVTFCAPLEQPGDARLMHAVVVAHIWAVCVERGGGERKMWDSTLVFGNDKSEALWDRRLHPVGA